MLNADKIRGGIMIKKRKYFWQKGYPLSDNSAFFEFQNDLKNADPHLGYSHIFEFENILTTDDPLGQTY